jgi:hypothetical protein
MSATKIPRPEVGWPVFFAELYFAPTLRKAGRCSAAPRAAFLFASSGSGFSVQREGVGVEERPFMAASKITSADLKEPLFHNLKAALSIAQ